MQLVAAGGKVFASQSSCTGEEGDKLEDYPKFTVHSHFIPWRTLPHSLRVYYPVGCSIFVSAIDFLDGSRKYIQDNPNAEDTHCLQLSLDKGQLNRPEWVYAGRYELADRISNDALIMYLARERRVT